MVNKILIALSGAKPMTNPSTRHHPARAIAKAAAARHSGPAQHRRSRDADQARDQRGVQQDSGRMQ
jgi:hypothetical protein